MPVDPPFDGRIIVTQHYEDWHRVERSCARLEAALRRIDAEADVTTTAA